VDYDSKVSCAVSTVDASVKTTRMSKFIIIDQSLAGGQFVWWGG
jgi:hypothetical protein